MTSSRTFVLMPLMELGVFFSRQRIHIFFRHCSWVRRQFLYDILIVECASDDEPADLAGAGADLVELAVDVAVAEGRADADGAGAGGALKHRILPVG